MQIWMRMQAGIDIVGQSIKLLWNNPVLLVYVIVPILIRVSYNFFYMEYLSYYALDAISHAVHVFFMLCLAHHAMHIVRQQAACVTESILGIFRRIGPVLGWIVCSEILFLLGGYPIGLLISLWPAKPFIIPFIAMMVKMVVQILIVLTGPIIATEYISLFPAIRRSIQVVLHNAWAYMGSWLILLLIHGIVTAAFMFSIGFTVWSLVVGELIGALIMVAMTLFYYQFYSKQELV